MINPANIIGGTFEAIEGLYEQATVRAEEKKEEPKEVQEQKKKSIEKTGVIYFNQRVAAEAAQAQAEVASKPTLEAQRTKMNTLLGFQKDYQGSVDAQGNVNRYHQAEAEKKEAETTSGTQPTGEKESPQGPAGSFEMGENELGLGGENKNHFTAAVG